MSFIPLKRERGNSERFNKGNQRRLRKRERNRQIEIAKKKKGVRERLWLDCTWDAKGFSQAQSVKSHHYVKAIDSLCNRIW